MKEIHEAVSLLNRGENSEAMKCFRRYHNIVNRWRCIDCAHTTSSMSANGCEMCSGDMTVVVVMEATK